MTDWKFYIGALITLLGLIAVILRLILYIKQIRRENYLEKQRFEEEKKKEIEKIELEKSDQEKQNEILEFAMSILTEFLENELPKKLTEYVRTEDLKELDKTLRKYLEKQLSQFSDTEGESHSNDREKIEKTLAEAFGVELSGQTFSNLDMEIFFKNRVDRRLKKAKR